MSILDIAKRLKIPDMDRLVKPYLENTISLRRIYLIFGLIIAVLLVRHYSRNPVILNEAISVLPFLGLTLGISIVWAYLIRYTRLKDNPWTNAIGSALDFIGIMLLMSHAWNLMLILVPFMMFSVISAGARYDDKYFYIAITISVLVVYFGAPSGYWQTRPVFLVFGVFLLIGLPLAMHKLIKTLRVISEYAVAANETQMRFLNTVSHELRTPLNSVIAGSTLLYDAPLSKEQRMVVGLIEDNGKNLLDMVNNILDHAALSNHAVPIKMTAFKVSELLDDVQKACALMAIEKGVDVKFALKDDGDVVFSDRGRVYLILNNLVNNAIKYSHDDSVVHVTAKRIDKENVQFIIADNGIGISDDDKKVIFDMFKRVGNVGSIQGSGLGLNLVKLNNDTLNGVISVTDNAPKGTVFSWTVPMREGTEARKAVTLSVEELYEHHRSKVASLNCLIIDDNLSNCLLLKELLRQAGHRSEYVLTGEAGLEKIAETKPDLVVLDINLGSMSGWDVLNSMEAWHLNEHTKVIISSAAVSETNSARAAKSGAIAFLGKPINVYELIGLIERNFAPEGSAIKPIFDSAQSPLSVIRNSADRVLYREYVEGLKADLQSELDFFKKMDFYNLADIASHLHFLKNTLNNLDMFLASDELNVLSDRVLRGELLNASDSERILALMKEGLQRCKTLLTEANAMS